MELSERIDAVFEMLDNGLYFEAMDVIEDDVLERTNGYANIGQPDEDDWIITIEGQIQFYPLVAETIELLESML